MVRKFGLGLDFGTLFARAILVNVEGQIVSSANFAYPHGVIEHKLEGTELEPGFALQHPMDYIEAMKTLIPEVLLRGAVLPHEVRGIGVDFTQCTMMPIKRNATPLCLLDEFRGEPHAYVKLWKHHAAQRQAEKLTRIARERQEPFLAYCGGQIYSETMFPKVLEILEKAAHVYEQADEFIELADWMTRILTGSEKRSESIAACASMWNRDRGYPCEAFFKMVDGRLEHLIKEKFPGELYPLGTPAGGPWRWVWAILRRRSLARGWRKRVSC